MKFESHWPKGSGGVSFFKQIIYDFLFLATLIEGHLSNIPMKFK